MIVKNRVLKQESTNWISPTYIEQDDEYGNNEWINLTVLQNFNDEDYAIVEDGVKIGVSSQRILFYGFDFDLPNIDIYSKKIEFRILCIDGTVGGSNIKDDYISINNNVLTPQTTFWTDQMTCIRNYSTEIYKSNIYNNELINDLDENNVVIGYSCIGTGIDTQIPMIYGVQARMVYEFYEWESVDEKAKYNTVASIDKYEISDDEVNLLINRYCTNSMNGVYATLYINLSDNLRFVNGNKTQTIKAENLEPYKNYTNKLKIFGKSDGLGKITLSSASMNEDITLYVLVKNNKYYNDHLTILNNNYFLNCIAESYGGAIYNNSYMNVFDSVYSNNEAEFGDDLYQAQTKINILLEETEFEINKEYDFQVKVTTDDGKKVNHGSIEIRSDKYSSYISKKEVNEYGVANFQDVIFSVLGNDTLSFNYIPNSNTFDYGQSSEKYNVDIVRKKTYLKVYETDIKQNSFLMIQLFDSDDKIITNETIVYNDNNFVINDDGYAYIMILNPLGEYELTFSFNGNEQLKECELKEKIRVGLEKINIITEDLYARKSYTSSFNVILNTEDGIPISNQEVLVNFYNPFLSGVYENNSDDGIIYIENFTGKGVASYKKTTDGDGKISIDVNYNQSNMKNVLLVKTETLKNSKYEGNKVYNVINWYESGTSSTEIILNDTNIKSVLGESTEIGGQLKDITGNSGLFKNTYNNTVYDIYILFLNQTNNNIYFYKTSTEYDGYFSVTVNELPIGKYTYKCIFTGNSGYDGCVISDTLDIYESGIKKTIIESSDYSGNINSIKPFGIYLLDEDNVPLENKKIHFSVKDSNQKINSYVGTTDSYGYCEYNMAYSSDVYLIETSFLGDEYYKNCINKNVFVINEKTSNVLNDVKITENTIMNKNGTFTCNYTLSDNFNPITDYLVLVSYDENGYNDIRKIATGKNGTGSFTITPKSTVTVINSIFVGNENYSAYEYLTLVYNPKNTKNDTYLKNDKDEMEIYVDEEQYYKTTLLDKDKNPISNGIIVSEFISSNGSRNVYYNKTNTEGEIVILLDFDADTYICNSYYIGEKDNKSTMSTCRIKVNQNKNLINTYLEAEKSELNFYYDVNNDGYFTVTLKADVEPTDDDNISIKEGKILTNKPISFLIINEDENVEVTEKDLKYIYTDSEGKANLPIDQYKGEYKIKFDFYGDNEYGQSSGEGTIIINVNEEIETLIEAYDTEINYGEDKNIFIRLVDTLNNPITNEKINIRIIDEYTDNEILNTKTLTDMFGLFELNTLIYTDDVSGRIKIPLKKLHSGKYIIDITYDGNRIRYTSDNQLVDKTYKPISKTIRLTVKEKSDLEEIYLTTDRTYYKTSYENNNRIYVNINQHNDFNEYLESNSNIINDYIIFDFYNRANKRFTFTKEINSSTNEEGFIEFYSIFDLGLLYGGTYDCYIKYPTQTDYKECETQVVVEVDAKPTIIVLYPNNKNHKSAEFSYMSDETIQAKLTQEDGITPIKNEYLIFNINGKNYNVITNEFGIGEIPIRDLDLSVGEYEINIWNISNENYYSDKVTGKVIIEKSTFKVDYVDEIDYIYGENYNYDVNVKYYRLNRGGNSSTPINIPNISVTFETEIDGIKYSNTQVSDNNGNVFFKNLPLTSANTYICKLTISGQNLNTETIENIRLIVHKNNPNLSIYYNDLLYRLTSTLNLNGVGISDKNLNITVDRRDSNDN